MLQKSEQLTVLQADLLQGHLVGWLPPCPKFQNYDAFDHTNHTFSKALGPRTSGLIFPGLSCTSAKTQVHKYTNTQIQSMTKCKRDPTCGIFFLKRRLFKDTKNDIPVCQAHKYENTNTQIQRMTGAGRTQHVV